MLIYALWACIHLVRLVNLVRACVSTRFFTSVPPKGGLLSHYPSVTIQICAYNELSVIEGTIDAACNIDWPHKKLTVQVLDDSTDNAARSKAKERAEYWQRNGINCQHLTRPTRHGFKAGNLKYHFKSINGEFVAYFDSDHRCDPKFLQKTVPHFFCDRGNHLFDIGLVQTPWYVVSSTLFSLLLHCLTSRFPI